MESLFQLLNRSLLVEIKEKVSLFTSSFPNVTWKLQNKQLSFFSFLVDDNIARLKPGAKIYRSVLFNIVNLSSTIYRLPCFFFNIDYPLCRSYIGLKVNRCKRFCNYNIYISCVANLWIWSSIMSSVKKYSM